MHIALDIRKSVEENAATYFDAAKKAKGKISGAEKAIHKAEQDKEKASKEAPVAPVKQVPKKIRKKAWYEKFKWFWASNGMLVIAGRDAVTNEMLIKKHVDKQDLIFHTGAAGSPFTVLKTDGNAPGDQAIQEAADFCASHSKAWKLGLSSVEVYWVNPEQVTKEAKAGEYMQKGSFMVYGKRNFVVPKIGLVAIPFQETIMICPENSALPYYQGTVASILQGETKASDAAKKVIALLGTGEPDDVIPGLPAGGCTIKKKVLMSSSPSASD